MIHFRDLGDSGDNEQAEIRGPKQNKNINEQYRRHNKKYTKHHVARHRTQW